MLRESPFGSLPVREVSLYFCDDAIFQKHGCALGHLKIPVCIVLDLLVKDFLAHNFVLCLPAMRIGGRVILKPLGPLGPQRSQDSLCAVGQVQSLIATACHWCP
jgi:hypothetical protein